MNKKHLSLLSGVALTLLTAIPAHAQLAAGRPCTWYERIWNSEACARNDVSRARLSSPGAVDTDGNGSLDTLSVSQVNSCSTMYSQALSSARQLLLSSDESSREINEAREGALATITSYINRHGSTLRRATSQAQYLNAVAGYIAGGETDRPGVREAGVLRGLGIECRSRSPQTADDIEDHITLETCRPMAAAGGLRGPEAFRLSRTAASLRYNHIDVRLNHSTNTLDIELCWAQDLQVARRRTSSGVSRTHVVRGCSTASIHHNGSVSMSRPSSEVTYSESQRFGSSTSAPVGVRTTVAIPRNIADIRRGSARITEAEHELAEEFMPLYIARYNAASPNGDIPSTLENSCIRGARSGMRERRALERAIADRAAERAEEREARAADPLYDVEREALEGDDFEYMLEERARERAAEEEDGYDDSSSADEE